MNLTLRFPGALTAAALIFAACGSEKITPPLANGSVGTSAGSASGGATGSNANNGNGSTGATGNATGDGTSSSNSTSGTGTGTGSGGMGGTTNTDSSGGSTGGVPCLNCAAGKLCDANTGRCVDCAHDSDCPTDKPVCQSSTSYLQYGQCVGCSEGEPTCPASAVCDLSIGKTYHQCVQDCRLSTSVPACPADFFRLPQHCVDATGTCVRGCATSADCLPELLSCDTDAGQCVECLSTADCPYSNSGCYNQRCGTCQTDLDCPSGLACESYGYLGYKCGCPDGGGCGGDAPVCIPTHYGNNICGCESSADCAPQQGVCRLDMGGCLPPCNDGGTDCTLTNQFCDLDSGLCGPCAFDSQCTGSDAGPVCLAAGYCGCTANSDCGSGNVCDSVFCRASCAIDGGTSCSTLAGRHFCDLGTGLCNPCSNDSQCLGDDAGPHCLNNGDCGCNSASDCGLGGACNYQSVCVQSCTVDGGPDCSLFDEVCDPVSRACVQCLDDSQCPPQAPACTADVHQGNICVQCVLPSQCPDSTPGCTSQQCGWCQEDVDCPSSLPICHNNQCVTSCVLADGGTYCATGACDTISGFCVECLHDNDCPQASYPYCATDVDAGDYCVQCTNYSQCPDTNPGCYTDSYYFCGGCVDDSDCPPSAPLCANNVCEIPCDGGVSCPTGGCDVDLGYCVQCVQDSDCQQPDLPYCAKDVVSWADYCVQCVASSNCGDAGPCNGYSLQCGSCWQDSDCPPELPTCSYYNGYCTDGGF